RSAGSPESPESGGGLSRWDFLVASWSVEVGASREVEGRHHYAAVAADVIGGGDAEPVRRNQIRACLHRALSQPIHGTVAIPLRRKDQLFTLEDHRQVGRKLPARPPFVRAVDAEDHPHPPLPGSHRPLESHPNAASIDAWPSLAGQSRPMQIDVEFDCAAN